MYTSNTNTEAFVLTLATLNVHQPNHETCSSEIAFHSPKNNTHLLTGWFRPTRVSPPVAASVSAAPRGCPRPSTLQEAGWLGTRSRQTLRRCRVLFLEWWLRVARRISLPPRPASGSRDAGRLIVQAGRPGEEAKSKQTTAVFSLSEAPSQLELGSAEICFNFLSYDGYIVLWRISNNVNSSNFTFKW